eukprot:TRINITY_DN4389_c0_g1_i13.p1 TRINITY_DN4389_c0_g1~~TRINITY_DN4389_c0_g1_i13.p1  ORF type:complete len:288 (-),score=53.17 TRINITY_DN4389_c0_g1_i13:124-987(-)
MMQTSSSVTAASSMKGSKNAPNTVLVAYAIFAVGAFSVYHHIANGEFSAILTLAVMLQSLSFIVLGIQIWQQGNVCGISARSLGLEALSFVCRLSSTTWLNGYLPVDASGDFVYQACDVASLVLVLYLLYQVVEVNKATYDDEADTLPVMPVIAGCLLGAIIFHADMNARPIFDTLWMTGLFLSVFSVLPQLYLIHRTGGKIKACTGHYIAILAISRLLSGTFMWHARFDVTCAPWVEGVEHAIWAILGAHALHLVMLADFGYYYIKAISQQGLNFEIEIPAAMEMV